MSEAQFSVTVGSSILQVIIAVYTIWLAGFSRLVGDSETKYESELSGLLNTTGILLLITVISSIFGIVVYVNPFIQFTLIYFIVLSFLVNIGTLFYQFFKWDIEPRPILEGSDRDKVMRLCVYGNVIVFSFGFFGYLIFANYIA